MAYRKVPPDWPQTYRGADNQYYGECSLCGRNDVRIIKRFPDGRIACNVCGTHKENCSRCGKLRIVATRIDEHGNRVRVTGDPLCYDCSAQKEKCADCKKEKIIYNRLEGTRGKGPGVCHTCWQNRWRNEKRESEEAA